MKYQSQTEHPFETHIFSIYLSVASITIFLVTYSILGYYTDRYSDMGRLSSPTVYFKILVSSALFSVIYALLSLVLVLVVPPNLMWILDSVIALLLIPIIAYKCIRLLISLGTYIHMNAIRKLVTYIRDILLTIYHKRKGVASQVSN